MTAFGLIPGAGGAAWHWHRVAPLLRDAGHEVVTVELPADDESAGLPEYARIVADALGPRDDVVLVAQSFAGFTVPLVAGMTQVHRIVLVNAMIPVPGGSADQWWDATGWAQAFAAAALATGYRTDPDRAIHMLHDVPPDVAAAEPPQRTESPLALQMPCNFTAWPCIPTRIVSGADDRFFPVAFQSAVAQKRLGIEPDVLPGGHLIALAQPAALASCLLQDG